MTKGTGLASEAKGPAIEQPHYSFGQVLFSWRRWWREAVKGTVDQAAVIASRREEAAMSARYLFMLAMSAGIAILGLLLSSPAVVIGAMLLSPLMGPIMGLGFALATGDFHWMRQAARSLAVGTLLSILLCALIVVLSPLQNVTPEIASRTQPNLFDLGVALFSALAGAYAMIRGREGTIVGVAIATALMPPLAVVGFGLATVNWTVFSGSLLLFFTNLMTIALTAAIMARLYGFSTRLSEKQTNLQTALIVIAFVALAIPLGLSLVDLARNANATRQINGAVLEPFDDRARLSQIDVELNSEPAIISAVVLTPQLLPDATAAVQRRVERILGRPANVNVAQVEVGGGGRAAEEAQLVAARAREEAALQEAEDLASRMALIAGVPDSEVLVDRERRRAVVAVRPLDGASLGAYRELERRLTALDPEWDIRLTPPALPLPAIEFEDDALTSEDEAAVELIAWAGQRISAPIALRGPRDAVQTVRERLGKSRVLVRIEPSGDGFGRVEANWAAPDGFGEAEED